MPARRFSGRVAEKVRLAGTVRGAAVCVAALAGRLRLALELHAARVAADLSVVVAGAVPDAGVAGRGSVPVDVHPDGQPGGYGQSVGLAHVLARAGGGCVSGRTEDRYRHARDAEHCPTHGSPQARVLLP